MPELDRTYVDDRKSYRNEGFYNMLIHLIETTDQSPCTKFKCPMQNVCAKTKMDCKAFRYWVNNDSYKSSKKGKLTCISKDMTKYMRPIECMTKEEYKELLKEEEKEFYRQCREFYGDSMPDIEDSKYFKENRNDNQ